MPAQDSRRAVWIALVVVALGIGWLIGLSTQVTTATRNQYLTLDKEEQEDARELELIRKVSAGDPINMHTDLLMLADVIYTTSEPSFDEFFTYLATRYDNLPTQSECQIWTYDLFNLELEGTKQYFLVIHDGRIVEICSGYSVTL